MKKDVLPEHPANSGGWSTGGNGADICQPTRRVRSFIKACGREDSIMPLSYFNTLRREVKHKMVDLDLDRRGSYDVILPRLSEAMGRNINKHSLCMALTGLRDTKAYYEILGALKTVLDAWPQTENEPPDVY